VIQIAPRMRILVAIEAVDGRKGIDSLARLCQEKREVSVRVRKAIRRDALSVFIR
jgi:hypothetical protein